jgi:hypothetical protein
MTFVGAVFEMGFCKRCLCLDVHDVVGISTRYRLDG